MRKIFLLLLGCMITFFGCDKEESEIEVTGIESAIKKFNITDKNIEVENFTETNDITYFFGLKSNKLWFAFYDNSTKKQISEIVDNEVFNRDIKSNTGEIIDRITNIHCTLLAQGNNHYLLEYYFIASKESIKQLFFCNKNSVIKKENKKLDISYTDYRYWADESWGIYYYYSYNDYPYMTKCIDIYSFDGNFMFTYKHENYDVIPVALHEIIAINNNITDLKRININSNEIIWKNEIKIGGLVINIQTQRIIDKYTLEIIYNVYYYDTNRHLDTIVHIDIYSGNYTIVKSI